ncbi:MAG: hypothetical protein ACYTGZ_17280 [Planctomycetota bacterium]|jgi:hypothetical protein
MGKRLIFTALVSFGLGVAVTFLFVERPNSRSTARRGEAAGSYDAGSSAPARLAEAEEREARLQETVTGLRKQLDEYAEREAGAAAKAKAIARATEGGPRYVYNATDATLRKVDWKSTGKAMAELMPLLSEAAAVTENKVKMRPELWGEITTSIGPVITAYVRLSEDGVDWSHPSVLVNVVHATLLHAGQPLNADQEEQLDRIGMEFVESETRRAASYGRKTPELKKLIDTSVQQEQLYVRVRTILHAAQLAALYPEGVRGVVSLDVFSGGNVWNDKIERIDHTGRESLRQACLEKHVAEHKLRAELVEALKPIIAEWEAGLPDEFVLAKATPAQIMDPDLTRAGRAMIAAKRQLALYEAVLARVPLNDSERKRLLGADELFVPVMHR